MMDKLLSANHAALIAAMDALEFERVDQLLIEREQIVSRQCAELRQELRALVASKEAKS